MPQRIFTSPTPPPFIPRNSSFSQFLLDYNPDNVFDDKVIFQDLHDATKTFTYGGIRTAAAQGAAGLKHILEIKPGDIVLIIASNSLDWIHLAHSIIWSGSVSAAINPAATKHELVHYLTVCQPKIVVVEPELAKNVYGALDILGQSLKIVPTVIGLSRSVESSSLTFPQDFIGHGSCPPYNLKGHDNRKTPAALCFSSGTSGRPKGVLLSHHNVISIICSPRAADPFAYGSDQREVFYGPFCHVFGLFGCVTQAPFQGNFMCVMRKYDYQTYVNACARYKVTKMLMVPPTAISMAKDPFVKSLDLSSVNQIICSGAPLQAEVVNALTTLLNGVYITQGYGMSEWAGIMLSCKVSAWKAGSIGKLHPNQYARLVDNDLNDVPIGEHGELLVRGSSVFMGYVNNPKATEESFVDGWLRTGDVLRIDADGFFWITDRKKELIKYKGNQIPPAEIEDVLLSHPAVADAACCGIWDNVRGTEIPMAYVSLQPKFAEVKDRQYLLSEIQQHVDERVSSYKQLRGGVHLLATIPRNPTGKLLRRLLPARLEAEARAAAKNSRIVKL